MSAANPSPTWFRDLIKTEVEKRGGDRGAMAKLAKEWDISHSQLSRWISGTEPTLASVEAVLSRLGGDIARALPGWDDEEAEIETEIAPICGTISGGDAKIAFTDIAAADEGIEFEPALLRGLARDQWKATQGPVFGLRVCGTSMEPVYPNGSTVLMRNVASLRKVQEGWAVAFQEDDEEENFTLKLYYTVRGSKKSPDCILGVPINTLEHKPVVWLPDMVRVHSVLLASIGRDGRLTV